jgi:hypothetical protein
LEDREQVGNADEFVEVGAFRRGQRSLPRLAMELMYRQASRHPWRRAPAEKPFTPDGRLRTAEWLLAKAKAYRNLEQRRRNLARVWAEDRGESRLAEEQIGIAEKLARTASIYDGRARLARELGAHK